MRTTLPEEYVATTWLLWVFVAGVAACLGLLVVIVILVSPNLRRKPFNTFVLGLVFPDLIFSGFCSIACLLNFLHGQYWGGDLMCNFQSMYSVYGFSASIWMNALISRELRRMAECPERLVMYRPPSRGVVARRVIAVHAAAVLFSLLPLLPFLPAQSGYVRGLACLPVEYDVASTVYQWTVVMLAMMVVPLLFILFYFSRIQKLVLMNPDAFEQDRAVANFFLKLFCIFLFAWLPAGLFIWVFVYPGDTMGVLTAIGGTISHLQGVASALVTLRKRDIRVELSALLGLGRAAAKRRRPQEEEGEIGVEAPQMSISLSRVSSESQTSNSNPTAPGMAASMENLAEQMHAEIMSKEVAPMVVIDLAVWLRHRRFPRSSDRIARPLMGSDVVVFISHRWWGDGSPDSEGGQKYALLCRGLAQLVRRHMLDGSRVAIWCDWACIEQDDVELLRCGVASLITYAARSAFVLIPVDPEDEPARIAFQAASHPVELVNYGERGWCRLEAYIFSCVAEVLHKQSVCYAFGAVRKWCSRREVLKTFTSGNRVKEIFFDMSQLPSSGSLTVESDRAVIRLLEESTRGLYVRHAILWQEHILESEPRRKMIVLNKKQIACSDVPQLVTMMQNTAVGARVTSLSLSGNLLAAEGVAALMEGLACVPRASPLRNLCLSGNPSLGAEAIRHLADALVRPSCRLTELGLAHCRLSGSDAAPLATALSGSRLASLDVSYNQLDDAAVQALLEGACGLTALYVEGNDISVSTFRRACNAASAVVLGQGLTRGARSEPSLDSGCGSAATVSFGASGPGLEAHS